jgi:hypothetical protein
MPTFRVSNTEDGQNRQGRLIIRKEGGGFARLQPGESGEFELAASHARYYRDARVDIEPVGDASFGDEGRAATSGEFDPARFVDRTLDNITDEEIAALSAEQRDAVIDAENARSGGGRAGLLSRLTGGE